MISKPIGLLWDSVSNNVGDQAIGLVMRAFFAAKRVPYQVVNPFSYKTSDYETVVIGGGELIRRSGDPFYDQYRLPGAHILNTVGAFQPDHLEYLRDYKLVSVRSHADRYQLEPFINHVKVVPCVTMVMRDFYPKPANLFSKQVIEEGETIGVHVNLAMGQRFLEMIPLLRVLNQKYKITLFPFTLYQNDSQLMAALQAWIPDITISWLNDPVDILHAIGKMRALISSSLHASIFAYSQNIPVLAFPCVPKIKYFFEERGLGQYLYTSPEELSSKLDQLLANHPDWSDKINSDKQTVYEHLDEVIAQATNARPTKPASNQVPLFEFESKVANAAKEYHRLTMHHLEVWSQLYAKNITLLAESELIKQNNAALLLEKDKLIVQNEAQIATNQVASQQIREKNLQIESLNQRIDSLNQRIDSLNQQVDSLNLQVAGLNQCIDGLNQQVWQKDDLAQSYHLQLAKILNSTAWKVVLILWSIRVFLIPHGSRREKFAVKLIHSFRELTTKPIISHVSDENSGDTEYSGEFLPLRRDVLQALSCVKHHELAVVLHLYYGDLWDEFSSYLENLKGEFDLYITMPERHGLPDEAILREYPNAVIYHCENRGRDILPFVELLNILLPLNYKYACKIHTKKSTHRQDGSDWRNDMLEKLLGSPQQVTRILTALDENSSLGIIAPHGHILPHNEMHWPDNIQNVIKLAEYAQIGKDIPSFSFAAGSMFWFRPQAFAPILQMHLSREDFEAESGQLDGTLAHAFERFFGLLATYTGYQVLDTGSLPLSHPTVTNVQGGKFSKKVHQEPLIVYQMGKVGSKTIELSLNKAYEQLGLQIPVYHAHVLSNLDAIEARVKQKRTNPTGTLSGIEAGRELVEKIRSAPGLRWNVITLVREPVARNIGAFFHNLSEFVPDWQERRQAGQLSVEELREIFINLDSIHSEPEIWFDRQMKPVFDLDVYASPFPYETGYQIYDTSPKARLLLLRLESLNQCAAAAMHEFLGLENFKLYNTNLGEEKDYADLYNEFRQLALPEKYIRRIYGTPFARHFYTNNEISTFIQRWTKSV